MRRYLSILLFAVLLILVLLGISVHRRNGKSRRQQEQPHSRPDSKQEYQQPLEYSGAAVPKPRNTNDAIRHALLDSWRRIGATNLSRPILIASDDTNNGRCATYWDYLQRLGWEVRLLSFDPRDIDIERRALAGSIALDHLIGKHAGLAAVGKWSSADPSFYFPAGPFSGFRPPADLESARAALLDLYLSDGVNISLEGLPPQHYFPGVENAIKSRALAMLGSLGWDEHVATIVRRDLYALEDPLLKATAFRTLVERGEVQYAMSWFDTQTGEVLLAAIQALAPSDQKLFATSDPRHAVAINSHVSLQGREFDGMLVSLAANGKEVVRATLAPVLAGRCDNPAVRTLVLDMLRDSPPDVQISILRQRPPLLEDPRYKPTVLNLLSSKDKRVLSYAIEGLSTIPNPGIRDIVVGFLDNEDPMLARVAVRALYSSGRYDPVGTIDRINQVIAKRSDDPEFLVFAKQTLDLLYEFALDPVRARNKHANRVKGYPVPK